MAKQHVMRTEDARREDYQKRIIHHTECIAMLEKKILDIGKPRKTREKKDSYARITADLKAAGRNPEEVRALLGL